MWRVEKLAAVDENDNRVDIDCNRVTVTVKLSNGLRISRDIQLDETPPCLRVAVNDLIKLITD